MTDGQLVQAFVGGDHDAFAELVHRHVHWVWGCALRQVRDTALAEDITQGVFILLARKAASLPAGVVQEGLDGWLFRVVHYLARDARKISARRQFHETRVAAMKREEIEPGRDWDAVHALLDDAVAKLREQDRRIVLLRFYQRMSLGDLAGAMHVSEASAAKRVSRAVTCLRDVLAHQGYGSVQQIQEVLETAMACAAPAALVAQIAAGGHSAAATLLASKAAKMLVAAKLKTAAAITCITLAAAGVVGGVVTATSRPAPKPTAPVAAAPAPTPAPEPVIQAPPMRPDTKTTAVCLTILALPQNALGDLRSIAAQTKLDPELETRLGDAAQLRPILRDLTSRYGDPDWYMVWNRSGQFDDYQQDRRLSAGPGRGNQPFASIRSNVQVSAGQRIQIAGGYSINYMGNAPLSSPILFAPQELRPGQILVHITRTPPGPQNNTAIVMVYEAVTTDKADVTALTCQTSVNDWFAKPLNEHLRIARAAAVWSSKSTLATEESVRSQFSRTLPSGARIWVDYVTETSMHPAMAWLADGQPASILVGGALPRTASLRIIDPNLPPRVSPTKTYEAWVSVPLKEPAPNGYAFRIGYGDGPYKVIGRMPLSNDASFKVGAATVELRLWGDSYGSFVVKGDAGCDVELCAVAKDGTRIWNRGRYETWYLDGASPKHDSRFEFGMPLSSIEAIEVGTRPIVWVDFQGVAAHPTLPLPTGLELAPLKLEERVAAAVPTDRKAFLDQVQCMRFWTDTPATKQDIWVWRDGRYRTEAWAGTTHTLLSGDEKTFAEYDFAAGQWVASSTGRPALADFQSVISTIGGIEQMLKLGDVVGQEKVEGVECTIRKAKQESTEVRVWLDALGLVRRMEFADAKMGGGTISYGPPDAERVWYPPAIAGQKPFEQIAQEYLAKAVPIGKPLYAINSAGREMKVLGITRVQDDMVLLCTSTQLDAEVRKHRDETKERWLATQLTSFGPPDAAWTPRVVARIHMPWREVTWWVAQLPKGKGDPDLLELLLRLGRSGPGDEWWTLEKWIDGQSQATRLHLMQLDIALVQREDLEAALRKVYAVVEGYRALTKSDHVDLVTPSRSWDEFNAAANKAIAGQQSIMESGR